MSDMHWFPVIIISIIALFLVSRATYRIAAPFWSRQPVFHPYRLDLWFRRGVIGPDIPEPDKDVDRSIIHWQPVAELPNKGKKEITSFISQHFLRTSDAVYTPEWKHISLGMEGCPHPSVFCIGRDRYGGMIASISARPLTLKLPGRKSFWLYYIDNLCVHSGHRRRGLAPKAIRTLYQDIREKVRDVRVYLFKREGSVMRIMPLTVMDVCVFQSAAFKKLACKWPDQNMLAPKTEVEFSDVWSAALEMAMSSRVCIHMPMPSAIHAFKNLTMRVYAARGGDKILGVALFREPACTYEGEASIELASVVHSMSDTEASYFIAKACHRACVDSKAKLVVVDGCGQSGSFHDAMSIAGRSPVFKTRTSLFLYNYAEKPHAPSTCTFLF